MIAFDILKKFAEFQYLQHSNYTYSQNAESNTSSDIFSTLKHLFWNKYFSTYSVTLWQWHDRIIAGRIRFHAFTLDLVINYLYATHENITFPSVTLRRKFFSSLPYDILQFFMRLRRTLTIQPEIFPNLLRQPARSLPSNLETR